MGWNLSCPDWAARMRAGRSIIPDLPLDRGEAERAVGIWNKLRLPDVPGTPSLAEAGGDWFRDIVRALFGSVDRTTGHRMVREVFNLVPKKNSKTTGASGLMLTALLMNRRPRAEFLLVGPTLKIAELAFDQAVGMIEEDEERFLRKRMHIQGHIKTITDRRTGASLTMKAFDPSVLTGVKPAGALIDELHEIAANAKAARVIGQLRGGLAPNVEGFLVFITTQSDVPPSGVFRTELLKARAIRDGKQDGEMLPVLYEFPPEIMTAARPGETPPWGDPALWHMVNPNLGKSISLERLVADHQTAVATGEDEVRRWASQHLNIEIGLALLSNAWTGADFWEQAAEPALTLDDLLARSEVVTIGIDGGGLDDLLGLSVVGRETETGRWLLWTRAWAHQSALEQRKSEAPRYKDFAADGDLVIVEAIDDDMDDVADIVEKVEASGKLDRIGVDVIGVGGIVDAITGRGIDLERIVGIPQGYKLSSTIKTAERKLAGRNLVHGGQAMMAWCVSNAKVEPKGNAILITKQASGTGKIDPLMAAFDAIALMATNPASRAPQAVWL